MNPVHKRMNGPASAHSKVPDSTDVLIVGAGPVGLALAIELGLRGVACCVIERNDRVGLSPRAKTTNVRTREHLRRWGLAQTLRDASPIPPDYPADVVFATRMNGPALARFENVSNARRDRSELYSEEGQWVPQYTLEEVLRDRASSLQKVALQFGTELVGLSQDGNFVIARVYNLQSGSHDVVRSKYLVGADGARSLVRDAIGVTMVGDPSAAVSNYSIIFRAPDLAGRHAHGRAIMYWLVNADVSALLGPMDRNGLWFFMATKLPDNIDPATIDATDMIRLSTGLTDLQLDIERCDSWIARSLVADRYSDGRVFLAGDACHLHPPFGGFGMNMGIGDAVDLGWKLAGTLRGWGGPNLLASYQQERKPVHERTINEATVNYSTVGNDLVRAGIEDTGPVGESVRRAVGDMILGTKVREFSTLGLVLGANYHASPIIASDGSAPPLEHSIHYVPSASPGCLAPHLWLADGSSLYDHLGPDYTLLITDCRAADASPFTCAAQALGVPLTVLAPGDPRLGDLYRARFALIRPDQHIAWRGDDAPSDIHAILKRIAGHANTPRNNVQQTAALAAGVPD